MVVEAASQGLLIMPSLVLGVIVGFIELIFVHSDEAGMGWFKHGLHALPFAVLFVFVNMNIQFVLDFFNLNLPFNAIFLHLGVGLIAFIKIQGAAAIAGRTGERIWHTLVIALLVVASPYIWQYAGSYLPSYLQ